MSRNMKMLKTCKYCMQEFTARKTIPKTCSHKCGQHLYTSNLRNNKIEQAAPKEVIKPMPKTLVTKKDIRII
jgi:hypothetical protein